MFSFLTKSDKPSYLDKVWQTKQACLKGMAAEALNAIKNSKTPVVFFFFEEVREKFIEFLDSNQLAHQVIGPGTGNDVGGAGTAIALMNAFTLESREIGGWLNQRSRVTPLVFLFLGHYPLLLPEDRVLEKLREQIGNVPIVFGVSLEDPLFQDLGSDRIKVLMGTLGMKEDECIEHNMVSKAIFRARKKLDDHVRDERKTATEAEWFIKNIKQQL